MAKRLADDAAEVRGRTLRLEFTIFAVVIVGILLLTVWGLALVRNVSKALRSTIIMIKDLAEGEGDSDQALRDCLPR